jgi:hypothetical protein
MVRPSPGLNAQHVKTWGKALRNRPAIHCEACKAETLISALPCRFRYSGMAFI